LSTAHGERARIQRHSRFAVDSATSNPASAAGNGPALPQPRERALRECMALNVRRYLADLDGTPCREGLYARMLREVEAPLLIEVLAWSGGNQSRAAATLGINRATLRKKMHALGLA
jgi:Fis family transcriptional regulator, factor for inversion stimulation protein